MRKLTPEQIEDFKNYLAKLTHGAFWISDEAVVDLAKKVQFKRREE